MTHAEQTDASTVLVAAVNQCGTRGARGGSNQLSGLVPVFQLQDTSRVKTNSRVTRCRCVGTLLEEYV